MKHGFTSCVRSFTILVKMMFGSEFLTRSLASSASLPSGCTRHARLPAHEQYKHASVAGALVFIFTKIPACKATGKAERPRTALEKLRCGKESAKCRPRPK